MYNQKYLDIQVRINIPTFWYIIRNILTFRYTIRNIPTFRYTYNQTFRVPGARCISPPPCGSWGGGGFCSILSLITLCTDIPCSWGQLYQPLLFLGWWVVLFHIIPYYHVFRRSVFLGPAVSAHVVPGWWVAAPVVLSSSGTRTPE